MSIAVVGLGYVGTALAVLLAGRHRVAATDIDPRRVAAVNDRRSPVADPDIDLALRAGATHLSATTDPAGAWGDADVVFVATPTDYDPGTDAFDTTSVDAVVAEVAQRNPCAVVVIKSTVPVGHTRRLRARHPGLRLLFSPEFLREGRALHDCLHPTRVIVSDPGPDAQRIAELLVAASAEPATPIRLMASDEAEATKLFANTYLALRVAYFNELDTYAAKHGLDARSIIDGVGLDPRIGDHYNNPSFGYGGYCLPKDTRQLLANYREVPQNLIAAIVESNETRMDFVALDIRLRGAATVGVHRLAMKAGSDNARGSSVLGVLARLRASGARLVVYEPEDAGLVLDGVEVVSDLAEFKARADLIVANRWSPDLADVADRVYTRDLFGRD
ncbi:nucleotide sugar dehydrogenase [Propioniciclava sp.]|uniref:nucleotide sugar dehydrogenase n=1 Tax=Propioniciclava sp. TaxID=2038686 RepID=UPI00261E4907|nr:nucleotide sugar dehydrogenase [Propioniciclava sp.]